MARTGSQQQNGDTMNYATALDKWCNNCQLERAEHRVSYREYDPTWSTPNGVEVVQDVCHGCLTTFKDQLLTGDIWDLMHRRRFSNYTFTYTVTK
jgi:hypothetical protein